MKWKKKEKGKERRERGSSCSSAVKWDKITKSSWVQALAMATLRRKIRRKKEKRKERKNGAREMMKECKTLRIMENEIMKEWGKEGMEKEKELKKKRIGKVKVLRERKNEERKR